jgi:transcriptional regulator with XRE-family HTH domain
MVSKTRQESSELRRRFARNLRVARGHAEMTQEELAGEINVAVEVYRRYEMGQHWPNLHTLCSLAAALGCPMDALLGVTALQPAAVTRQNDSSAQRRLARDLRKASNNTLRVARWLLEELVAKAQDKAQDKDENRDEGAS